MENALSTHSEPNRTLLGRVAFALVLYVVFDGFSHGMFDVTIAPAVSLTIAALLFALAIVVGEAAIDRTFPLPKPWTLPVLMFVFVGYVAYSAVRGGGTFDLSFAKNLILLLLIIAIVRSAREVLWVLGAGAAAGLFQALLGLAQLSHEGAIPYGGLTGALPNHVQYAMYLLLSIIAGIALLLVLRGAQRVPLALVLAGMGLVLLMTLARGVVVAAAIVALASIFTTVRSRKKAMVLVAALVAVGGVAVILSGRLSSILELPAALSDPEQLDEILSGRLPLLIAAWAMFAANPIFGVGYGRYPELWTEYVSEDIGSIFYRRIELAAHSTYLQIMAELGAIGFALYGAMLFVGLKYSWAVTRLRDRAPRELWAAAAAVFLGLLAIAIHGVLDNTGWHDRVLYVFLALSVCVTSAAHGLKRSV